MPNIIDTGSHSNTRHLPEPHPDISGLPIQALTTEHTTKPCKIDISRNESPYSASSSVEKAAMQSVAKGFNTYPDPTSSVVRNKLGEVHNVDPKQVIVAPGSETLLNLIPQVYAGYGNKSIVFPELSYYRYADMAKVNKTLAFTTTETVEYGIDMDDLATASQKPDVQIVQIVNPSNPTGHVVPRPQIKNFLDQLPKDVLFVYDAAYAEFSTSPDYTNGIEFIKDYPNVLVLGTLSKAYGIAGLRIGYAIGSEQVIQNLNSARNQYPVSELAQNVAVSVLNDSAHMHATVQKINTTRAKFQNSLTNMNLQFVPSATNFVLVEFGENGWPEAAVVNKRLLEAGIKIRPMGMYNLNNHLRFSIGTDQDMEKVTLTLENIKKLHQESALAA